MFAQRDEFAYVFAVAFDTIRAAFVADLLWRLHDLRKKAVFMRDFLQLVRSCLRRERNITTLHKFTTDEKFAMVSFYARVFMLRLIFYEIL